MENVVYCKNKSLQKVCAGGSIVEQGSTRECEALTKSTKGAFMEPHTPPQTKNHRQQHLTHPEKSNLNIQISGYRLSSSKLVKERDSNA